MLIYAQVAFGRFLDRFVIVLRANKQAVVVTDFDHPDRVIRTVVRTRLAANTGGIVDRHNSLFAAGNLPADRAGGTLDHANRIFTVHARAGNHHVVFDRSISQETRVVVVRARTSSNAIIAARTAIHINQHGCRTVGETLLDQEFDKVRIEPLKMIRCLIGSRWFSLPIAAITSLCRFSP